MYAIRSYYGYEDRQFGLVFPEFSRLEQFPEDRDLPEQGNLGDILCHFVFDQAREHDGPAGEGREVGGHPAGQKSRDVGTAGAVVDGASYNFV